MFFMQNVTINWERNRRTNVHYNRIIELGDLLLFVTIFGVSISIQQQALSSSSGSLPTRTEMVITRYDRKIKARSRARLMVIFQLFRHSRIRTYVCSCVFRGLRCKKGNPFLARIVRNHVTCAVQFSALRAAASKIFCYRDLSSIVIEEMKEFGVSSLRWVIL
jgi:hypothetical protein